jgi:hypothetical protein
MGPGIGLPFATWKEAITQPLIGWPGKVVSQWPRKERKSSMGLPPKASQALFLFDAWAWLGISGFDITSLLGTF